jgi:hypothetical protein
MTRWPFPTTRTLNLIFIMHCIISRCTFTSFNTRFSWQIKLMLSLWWEKEERNEPKLCLTVKKTKQDVDGKVVVGQGKKLGGFGWEKAQTSFQRLLGISLAFFRVWQMFWFWEMIFWVWQLNHEKVNLNFPNLNFFNFSNFRLISLRLFSLIHRCC